MTTFKYKFLEFEIHQNTRKEFYAKTLGFTVMHTVTDIRANSEEALKQYVIEYIENKFFGLETTKDIAAFINVQLMHGEGNYDEFLLEYEKELMYVHNILSKFFNYKP